MDTEVHQKFDQKSNSRSIFFIELALDFWLDFWSLVFHFNLCACHFPSPKFFKVYCSTSAPAIFPAQVFQGCIVQPLRLPFSQPQFFKVAIAQPLRLPFSQPKFSRYLLLNLCACHFPSPKFSRQLLLNVCACHFPGPSFSRLLLFIQAKVQLTKNKQNSSAKKNPSKSPVWARPGRACVVRMW